MKNKNLGGRKKKKWKKAGKKDGIVKIETKASFNSPFMWYENNKNLSLNVSKNKKSCHKQENKALQNK